MDIFSTKEEDRSCAKPRRDLLDCLRQSDCVKLHDRTPRECLEGKNGIERPEECEVIRIRLYDCKRSLIDMRSRFRGRKDY